MTTTESDLLNMISQYRNGLLSEEDANNAIKILLNNNNYQNEWFTNEELCKIYIDVKSRLNFAPEENENWEDKLANSIFEKIEKMFFNKEKTIAVLSLDIEDFQDWKNKNNLEEQGLDTQRKFKSGNNTYICISTVGDSCSYGFDEIIETDYAKENSDYEEIKSVVRTCLNVI